MKKVLVATEKPFAAIAVNGIKKVLEQAGYQLVLLEKYTSKNEFINAVADVDALIIRSDIADKEVINAAKNLKIIVRAGAGYDNIDTKTASEKGIVAMNTPGQNSNAVAELVIGMMIYQMRNHFNGKSGGELKGKTLGIHAYGNVGKLVAKIAKGFEMEIYAFDPFIPKEIIEQDGVTAIENIEKLYEKSQFVSLHIPANEQTKKSINYNLLSKMPQGAMLVNTARKEIINEEDLLKIFAERKDFTYVSDIEPDNKSEFISKYQDRCFFTPKKMGAQTEEANINAGIAAANQIVDFFENGNIKFKVN
jgi:D-3-phosphoglycerate dehydrogenase